MQALWPYAQWFRNQSVMWKCQLEKIVYFYYKHYNYKLPRFESCYWNKNYFPNLNNFVNQTFFSQVSFFCSICQGCSFARDKMVYWGPKVCLKHSLRMWHGLGKIWQRLVERFSNEHGNLCHSLSEFRVKVQSGKPFCNSTWWGKLNRPHSPWQLDLQPCLNSDYLKQRRFNKNYFPWLCRVLAHTLTPAQTTDSKTCFTQGSFYPTLVSLLIKTNNLELDHMVSPQINTLGTIRL